MRYQGKIIKWNDERGFGFIAPRTSGQAIFAHARGFPNRQRHPLIGEAVSYEIGSDAQGRCCAENIRYADEKQTTVTLRISVVPMLISLLFMFVLAAMVWLNRIPPVIAAGYFLASLVTFLAYAMDKGAARSGQWRTQETTLFLMGLVGGWPGAVFAQQLLRHKSSKREFQFVFWVTVILNCGALAWLLSPSGMGMRLQLNGMI